MKNKKLSEKKLKAVIDIETTETGFVIWATSKNKDGLRVHHWILDASCLLESGEIHLGDPNIYNLNAVYDGLENKIIICKTKFKKNER